LTDTYILEASCLACQSGIAYLTKLSVVQTTQHQLQNVSKQYIEKDWEGSGHVYVDVPFKKD